MLKIDLKCQFDEFCLDLSEQLPTDKITGLFGSSGSGKSKLLRQLLGFDRLFQKQATIRFNSTNWQKKSEDSFKLTENRGIGYLPQTIDLFPHLNAKENILFSSHAKACNPHTIQNVFEKLNIENLLNKFPYQLSGGQQQRVGLARAIISAKNLLVLDEPFSAIGEDHKPQIMQLIKNINLTKKLPIIYSSHNRYEHAYLADHLITFKQGKVVQSGDYQDLATDINEEYAQVPDAINHIKARVLNFDSNYSVNCLKVGNHDLWAGENKLEKNQLVTLELRARDISISTNIVSNSSILNSLETTLVDWKEISGNQYLLKLSFENSFIIAFITKKSFFDLKLKTGINLYAMFKAVNILPISMS
ncbi:MAG: ATP-binding cassette domain-containing protein [Kangiellaceae bacterium]